jgi:HK97 family phage major capsid protein
MEAMDDIASGKFPIAIANWPRAYVVVDIGSTTMIRDEVTKKGWTSFYFAKRVGGALLDSNAVKLLKMA